MCFASSTEDSNSTFIYISRVFTVSVEVVKRTIRILRWLPIVSTYKGLVIKLTSAQAGKRVTATQTARAGNLKPRFCDKIYKMFSKFNKRLPNGKFEKISVNKCRNITGLRPGFHYSSCSASNNERNTVEDSPPTKRITRSAAVRMLM